MALVLVAVHASFETANRPVDPDAGEATGTSEDLAILVGKRGVATSPLLPSGRAEINGKPVNVITKGVSVEAGAEVEVVEVSGNRVVVRAVRG